MRMVSIPLHTPVLLYKSGVQGGIHVKDVFLYFVSIRARGIDIFNTIVMSITSSPLLH